MRRQLIYPQVPRRKHRRVLTETPPPHSREQLLQPDHSVQKYVGSLAGLEARPADGWTVFDEISLTLGPFPRLIGSTTAPSEPLDSFLTTTELFSSGHELTETSDISTIYEKELKTYLLSKFYNTAVH